MVHACITAGEIHASTKNIYGVKSGVFFFFFILRRMGKNKTLAHHTSAYFHTRVSTYDEPGPYGGTGAYVSLLAPGKTDLYACHPRKTTTCILHVVSITTHTHNRRKSFWEKRRRKDEERKKGKESEKRKRKGKDRPEKTRQEEEARKRKEKNVILADPRNWLKTALGSLGSWRVSSASSMALGRERNKANKSGRSYGNLWRPLECPHFQDDDGQTPTSVSLADAPPPYVLRIPQTISSVCALSPLCSRKLSWQARRRTIECGRHASVSAIRGIGGARNGEPVIACHSHVCSGSTSCNP